MMKIESSLASRQQTNNNLHNNSTVKSQYLNGTTNNNNKSILYSIHGGKPETLLLNQNRKNICTTSNNYNNGHSENSLSNITNTMMMMKTTTKTKTTSISSNRIITTKSQRQISSSKISTTTKKQSTITKLNSNIDDENLTIIKNSNNNDHSETTLTNINHHHRDVDQDENSKLLVNNSLEKLSIVVDNINLMENKNNIINKMEKNDAIKEERDEGVELTAPLDEMELMKNCIIIDNDGKNHSENENRNRNENVKNLKQLVARKNCDHIKINNNQKASSRFLDTPLATCGVNGGGGGGGGGGGDGDGDGETLTICHEPISDSYEMDARPFARGKFATVRRCVHKETNKEFAAKCIKKRRRLADCRHEILHEINVLQLTRCTNRIVDLYDVYETPSEMILILEMADGGELQRVLDDEEALEECHVRRIVKQILEGLVCLHENQIAHLDIKPQNILLTNKFPEGDIKLCDFGLSRRISQDIEVREICGTPDYVAPEILRYDPISVATDMWSVGVLTYVLLSGYSPFGSENKQMTYCNITTALLDFPHDCFDGVSREAIDFIQKLIIREPTQRLTSREALQHHWINENIIDMPTLSISPTSSTPSSSGASSENESTSSSSSESESPSPSVSPSPSSTPENSINSFGSL